MLRKLLALLLVIGFIGQVSGLVWDVEKLFTGRQMVPYGSPWIADDQITYWGTGKDFAITYDETTDDRTELTATTGMYFDVGAITFYSSDPANESLTFTGFYPVFNGGFIVGDDDTAYFGTSQDLALVYDETTDNRFEATMTSGGMYFDVTDVTFYTNDATNETFTFTGYAPIFAAGGLISDDQKFYFGTNSDAYFEYDENGDNVVVFNGTNLRIYDDIAIQFGTGGDGTLMYDETTDDQVETTGTWNFAGTVELDGAIKPKSTSTDVNVTIGDTGPGIYLVGNASANQYITLPTAADNDDRIIYIVIATAPGDNDVVVDGEGDETINGAATLTNTANVGESIQLICDGTGWYTMSLYGTWS